MATPYSWGFRRGEGNYQYQEFLKRRMEAERQADFAARIAEEQERISLSQWQPEPDETEVKIKTQKDGTSTVVSTEKFPAQSLLDDPMGLEGTGTGDWGASLLSGDMIPQAEIDEYNRRNDLYANPPADIGEIWPTPVADSILEPVDPRPANQQDILIPDNIPRGWRVSPEATVLPEAAVVQQAQDIPGVTSAQGMPVGGWGTGLQYDEPFVTDEMELPFTQSDEALQSELAGLLESEVPQFVGPQYADTTGRTAADYGIVRPPPNFAQRSRQGYFSRAEAPTYEEEIPVGPVAGTPEHQALVASIQASEVIPPDSPIYGDSQALGTVDEARVGVDAAVEQIIPQPQVVQPEPQPQEVSPFAAQQQQLIDESTQRYIQSQEAVPALQQPVLPQEPIPGPSLLDQPEVGLSWEDIVGGQAAEVVTPDVADPVERDILKSQSKGYVDPDTGLTPERRPAGVPALKDETAEERRIRIRREVEGLNLSDVDTEMLGLPEVAETLSDMYKMQKRAAMVQFANMLKEQQKKKVTKIRGVGRRRQGQQHAQLLNPTPLGMGDQYG